MDMTPDRLKHCLTVANKMKQIVLHDQKKYSINPNGAFVLGFVHSIGYAFTNDPNDYASLGGRVLERQEYKYWKEVFHHGKVQGNYSSPELDLLNYACLVTSPTGEYIAPPDRIKDIVKRYGEGSVQEKEVGELVKRVIGVEV